MEGLGVRGKLLGKNDSEYNHTDHYINPGIWSATAWPLVTKMIRKACEVVSRQIHVHSSEMHGIQGVILLSSLPPL